MESLERYTSKEYFASIDPGKHACGVAVWSGGNLIWASWVKNPFAKTHGKERVERWRDMGKMVAVHLQKWGRYGVGLILEIPQVYSGERDEDKNDLLDLAGVQGAIVGATGFDVEWSPVPREWKGQLPKEISVKRVEAKLSSEEKARIEWPAKSYRHNVYDAIHLGIVFLEREGLRQVGK
jgi:hypothetical protein